jgi:excisionase family DNA binding protein
MVNDKLLTVAEVSAYLDISQKSVLRMIKSGDLPAVKVASQWRFVKESIDAWIISKMDAGRQSGLSVLMEDTAADVPLSRLFNENLIFLRGELESRDDILRFVSECLYERGLIEDSSLYYSRLIDRENLVSTGVGHGIALPHLRNPDENKSCAPVICFYRSEMGINWNSHDKKDVDLVFLIHSGSDIVHLRMLAKLNKFLNKADSLKILKNCKSSEEVISYLIDYDSSLFLK